MCPSPAVSPQPPKPTVITTTINNVQCVYNNHNGSVTRGIIFIVPIYIRICIHRSVPNAHTHYIPMYYIYIYVIMCVCRVYTCIDELLLNIVRKRDTTTPLRGGSDRSSRVFCKNERKIVHKTSKRA